MKTKPLDPNSKSEKIRQQIRANPDASDKKISEEFGVSIGHVWNVRQAMIRRSAQPKRKVLLVKRKPEPVQAPAIDMPTAEEDEAFNAINENQIGGDHYKSKAIQPWDFISSNNLGYLEGNIVKYVSRWKDKGGVQDLEKAMHYLQKLIEVNT